MVLVTSPSHRFARRGSIPIGELNGETFVGFESALSIRKAIDRFLRRHGVEVEVALEFDNIENIKRAVEISAGVAILPEPTVAEEVRAGTLASLTIDGQDPNHRLTRPLAIIHRRHDKLDVTTNLFLELLTGREPDAVDSAASQRVSAASSS